MHAPAVIGPRGVEHWLYGSRHRRTHEGPALTVMPGQTVQVYPRPGARPLEITGLASVYFYDNELHRPVADGPALISGEHAERLEYWEHGQRRRRRESVADGDAGGES